MVIKDITHNHPSGSAFSSFGKTRGDVAFARYIEELTGQKPTFHIYSLNDGRYQYVKYGPNSTINDFILNGASINEIIVYGRKNKR